MAEILQGNNNEAKQQNNEAKLLADDDSLRKIALLYYEEGASQEYIAGKMNCSRQVVSKALQRAKERQIVRITIAPHLRTGFLRNLTRQTRMQLKLEDVVLVPGGNMNNIGKQAFLEDVVAEIASMGAEYLDQILTDSDVLAVSGGSRFMRNLVRYLHPTNRLGHMNTVATIGFVDARTNFGDANLIAHDLADAYSGTHLWFPCPAFLDTPEEVERIRQLPVVKEAYQMMQKANLVLTGLWTSQSNDELAKKGTLKPDELRAIEKYKPVADINHWLFDEEGQCVNEMFQPFPFYLTGLEIPNLRQKVAEEKTKVILLAGGSPGHVAAIRSVIRAGIVSILITDHTTAQLLIE